MNEASGKVICRLNIKYQEGSYKLESKVERKNYKKRRNQNYNGDTSTPEISRTRTLKLTWSTTRVRGTLTQQIYGHNLTPQNCATSLPTEGLQPQAHQCTSACSSSTLKLNPSLAYST